MTIVRSERLRFNERGYVVETNGARREETDAEFEAHVKARVIPDPTIYRESYDELRVRYALEAMGDAIRQRYECSIRIEACGGRCYLALAHEPPCLCAGDVDGPGSCPA